MQDENELLSEDQTATFLRLTVATLRNWRSQRRGPVPIKVGRRSFYRRQAINKWLLNREGTYVSEPVPRDGRPKVAPNSAKASRK